MSTAEDTSYLYPIPAKITAVNANDYTLAPMLGENATATGVSLNGFQYKANETVWILYAAGMPDNALILGRYNGALLYVDDSNLRLGIGTTSPSGPMTVQLPEQTNNSSAPQHVVLNNSGDTTAGLLLGYNKTSGYGVINAIDIGTAWHSLVLQAAGGNVGIGTTSPKAKLHVAPGSGAFLVGSATNIVGSEQTIFSAGAVTGVLDGDALVASGTTYNTATLVMTVPGSSYNAQNCTAGGNTYQFRLYSDGSLRVIRTAGSSTTYDAIVRALAL